MRVTIEGGVPLKGSVCVPADKSITHRGLMFAAIAEETRLAVGLLPFHNDLAGHPSTLGVEDELGDYAALGAWTNYCRRKDCLPEPSCSCEALRARRACAAGATQFFEAAPRQLRNDLNLSAWAVTGTDFKCPGWRDAIKKGNFAA